MTLFDFFKTKKEEGVKEKFVGRYQWILIIKQILGEDIPALEMQIATNKDLGERNEILEKLEKLEEYIHSDHFTNQLDVSSASKDIDGIIDEGYKNSVLLNDSELENRCLEINHNIIEYIKNFARKNGTLTEEKNASLDKIIDLRVASGFLTWMTLGDKLQTSDEQHAWMIISSLLNTNKKTTGFNKGNLIKDVLATLSQKDIEPEAERFRSMKRRLLENKKISDGEAKRIDELVEQGLAKNKKIHEQHPDRP